MTRNFKSGLRKYYGGYQNQFLNMPQYTTTGDTSSVALNDNIGKPYGTDVTNTIANEPISASVSNTPKQGMTNTGYSVLGNAALQAMPQKGPEGKIFGGIANAGLSAGSLAQSGALGSGALASGIGAAALPVAGVAGGLLVANQLSKAIAGKQDEYGVYKNDSKAAWGGMGNIADTMSKGRDLASNSGDYAYLSGEDKSTIKSIGRAGQIPIFGTITNGRGINRIKRKARDRSIELNNLQSEAQKNLSFSDTRQGTLDQYGTTYANGGDLGNANSSFFKVKGNTHENGGVSIGDNKEVEKNEVVYKGYVFSDRLPYKK